MHSLLERVGELFISGFEGNSPSADLYRQLEDGSLGGIVLFAENCEDHDHLKSVIANMQSSSNTRLFIAIDQEGGRVCRLYGKPAEYDSAESYGMAVDTEATMLSVSLARYQSDLEASTKYMSNLGINLLLGPVCDLRPDDTTLANKHGSSTALSERTFSADPDVVSEFVCRAVETTHQNHLLCCLKHAPGLGSVRTDPHFALGASSREIHEFSRRDMAPFRKGCAAGAEMVMTSHFLIPGKDTAPVTLSRIIVETLVKANLSEEMILVTDDLDMGALRGFGDIGTICIRALNAGHDLLLARSNATIVEGIAAVQHGLADGTVQESRLIEALNKVERLRATLEAVS